MSLTFACVQSVFHLCVCGLRELPKELRNRLLWVCFSLMLFVAEFAKAVECYRLGECCVSKNLTVLLIIFSELGRLYRGQVDMLYHVEGATLAVFSYEWAYLRGLLYRCTVIRPDVSYSCELILQKSDP